jgi:hypothetical protein
LIVESKLWLSSPDDFNDPFDMAASVTYEGSPEDKRRRYGRLVKQYRQDLNWKQRSQLVTKLMVRPKDVAIRQLTENYAQNRRAIGVYSFAGCPRSIQMWGHYSANQKGLCLQFCARPNDVLVRSFHEV